MNLKGLKEDKVSLATLLFCSCLFKQTLYLLVVKTGNYLSQKIQKYKNSPGNERSL